MGNPGGVLGVGAVAEEPEKKSKSEEPAKKKPFPGLLGGVVCVLLGGGIGIFFLVSYLDADTAKDKSFLDQEYAEVDLDMLHREMSPSSPVRMNEVFLCHPVLILNSNIKGLEEIQGEVEKRKKSLRGDILAALYRKPEIFFHRPDLMSRVSDLFLYELNASLGLLADGKPIISYIVFSEFQAPAR
jgi:hypothetical protein